MNKMIMKSMKTLKKKNQKCIIVTKIEKIISNHPFSYHIWLGSQAMTKTKFMKRFLVKTIYRMNLKRRRHQKQTSQSNNWHSSSIWSQVKVMTKKRPSRRNNWMIMKRAMIISIMLHLPRSLLRRRSGKATRSHLNRGRVAALDGGYRKKKRGRLKLWCWRLTHWLEMSLRGLYFMRTSENM